MDNTAGQTRTHDSGPTDVRYRASGRVDFDATAITPADTLRVACGFQPRYVRWLNITDRVEVEYFEGMEANSCLKTVAAGTRTHETANGGITVDERGFRVSQNATLAAILASKNCFWIAEG